MKSFYLGIILTAGAVFAQSATVPDATSTPGVNSVTFAGNPTYLRISYSPSGNLITEAVVNPAGSNVIVVRTNGGGLVFGSTQTCPACPPATAAGTGSFLITLTKSATAATDSWAGTESWCSTGTTSISLGAWFNGVVTISQAASGGLQAQTWTFNEQGLVTNPTTAPSGLTTTVAPAWIHNRPECGGNAALMIAPPSVSYNGPNITPPIPTFVRNSVQAVITQ